MKKMKQQYKELIERLGYQRNITLLEEQLEDIMDAVVLQCAQWLADTDPDEDIGNEDAQALLTHFGVKND